jgi:ribosomal protein L11 methylase PrmA
MSGRRAAPSSFRDPSGFVYFEDGRPYRHVNPAYRGDYEAVRDSGLFAALHREGLLVAHEEREQDGGLVLAPEKVPLVTYPYEWCFGQLKDAAFLTLEVQLRALEHGMVLRDASAYNVQFLRGRPVFIDTLSFGPYVAGEPWAAYRQFCQHFLAPLALVAFVDVELGRMCREFLDGVPIQLASKLLPLKARTNIGLGLHIHSHAKAYATAPTSPVSAKMSKQAMLGLVDSLVATVRSLSLRPDRSTWSDYYETSDYTEKAMESKRAIVREALATAMPATVWDIGANTGEFSRIASEVAGDVVAWDLDPLAVQRHYAEVKSSARKNVLPLVVDLANPSPALGWAHRERDAFVDRSDADLVMALALIHHLAIGNNVPLLRIAEFLAQLAPRLLVEYVPKEDRQVQRLLAFRRDVFEGYSLSGFESAFGQQYSLVKSWQIADSGRSIHLLERR